MTTTMVFGDYDFGQRGQPVPIPSYSRAASRTPGSNICLTQPINLSFNGTLVVTGASDMGSGSFPEMMTLIRDFSDSFKCGSCKELAVSGCDSIVIHTSGLVNNVNITPRTEGDPYVRTASYTIEMEIPSLSGTVFDNQPSGITSLSETWSVDFLEDKYGGVFSGIGIDINLDKAFTVTHSMSVSALNQCNGEDGITTAENYIKNELISSNPTGAQNDIFSFNINNYYNYIRQTTRNEHEGSIDVTETWVVLNNASGAVETFDVSVEESLESYIKKVSINGTIKGYNNISYTDGISDVTKSHMDNAYDFYNQISGSIYGRANAFIPDTLNPEPISKTEGYATQAGQITYNYSYDTRPINCVAEAKSEVISINHTFPNDIFASLTIPGRANGPLLQGIGTVGQRSIGVNIEAVLPVTGCPTTYTRPTGYDDFTTTFVANNITAVYGTYYLNDNTETYNPKTGRFTKNFSYVVGDC